MSQAGSATPGETCLDLAARTALVIPAWNEEPVIAHTLSLIPEGFFGMVVVADNGSTDRTAEVARKCGATVVQATERGYGAACLTALAALPEWIECVAFLQADGSEDPQDALFLLQPLAEDQADLVLGSRVMGTADRGALLPHQRFGNALAVKLIHRLWGYRYTDLGPFRAIRVKTLRALHMQEHAYGWTVEMQVRALQKGLRIVEVPVSYKVRVAGEPKVAGNLIASIKAGWRIIATILRLRFRQ